MLLSTFRKSVFMPSHLSKAQRDLIYRKKNHSLLTGEDPTTVLIGDESVQLVPLSRPHDEPATKSGLSKLISLMKTQSDWRNLPGFLIGLKNAGRNLRPFQAERIARKACEAGRWRTLMECLERVRGTQLGLWEVGVAKEMLWTAMKKSQSGGWTKGAVEKALKKANTVWAMMQDPRHRFTKEKGTIDPMRSIAVVGVMLQLHAAKVLRSRNKNDTDGKVQEFVDRLLAIWSEEDLHEANLEWNFANNKLLDLAPVWHGIKMAQQVLGQNHSRSEELANKLEVIEKFLQKARDVVLAHQPEGQIRRGLKVYDELSMVSS